MCTFFYFAIYYLIKKMVIYIREISRCKLMNLTVHDPTHPWAMGNIEVTPSGVIGNGGPAPKVEVTRSEKVSY